MCFSTIRLGNFIIKTHPHISFNHHVIQSADPVIPVFLFYRRFIQWPIECSIHHRNIVDRSFEKKTQNFLL